MLPVRDDLAAAVAAEWERLRRPGAWWTGVERVAIAAEVRASRSCALCRERRAAVTPYAVSGRHTARSSSLLLPVLVDAVHRMSTDPGRLSVRWYREVIAGGVSEGQFVETVGVVAMVTAIDTLARAIGSASPPLPEPYPGEPNREVPPGAEVDCAWVPTVPPEKTQDELAKYYRESLDRKGFVANMERPLTLVPDEQHAYLELSRAMYVPKHGVRTLTRPQQELLAATVSAENDCFY